MDKSFLIQETAPGKRALKALTEHSAFSIVNPNRMHSLIGGFANANQAGFHRADGAG